MERADFLARVRDAVGRGRLPAPPPGDPGLLVPDLPVVDLVEAFGAALAAVDGELHRGDALEAIAAIVDRHGAGPLLTWDRDELPVPGALDALVDAGCEPMEAVVPSDGRTSHQTGYVAAHLGLTGAEAAFAQSGSIVVRSGPGRPRMASLIPLVHVVLLEASRIQRSLAHWAAGAAATMGAVSNVVFVTGPSRTADIEQQLNLGVHGPRHLHVVLVED